MPTIKSDYRADDELVGVLWRTDEIRVSPTMTKRSVHLVIDDVEVAHAHQVGSRWSVVAHPEGIYGPTSLVGLAPDEGVARATLRNMVA